MRNEDLTGKVAVVTGASRSIGKHIARALHEAGATVAVTGRNRDTIAAAARSIGARCKAYVCDQRDATAIRRMADSVIADLGAPDILVNNAGTFFSAPVVDLPLDRWNDVLACNLTGVFLTTQAFLPGMVAKNRGDVFMISSMSGKKGDPGAAAYAASKFGLQGFSQALTYEVRKHNIRVMVLNPSSVDTGEDTGHAHGAGLHLHAADLAATIVHLACMPGRTLVRDMDIWGTNP
ncbi:MAG: SDR family NAD(P)-dependent oxidoreductase [Candidatus Hydrogenedentes bacterium]|nr:SDR family NAD(P)-dependent oxidoreductase [Candidatus Hydrogenedentota bacterium]